MKGLYRQGVKVVRDSEAARRHGQQRLKTD